MAGLETSQFWSPLLLCVAISSVFALLVLYYFRQQINNLDHKINSMFSLITSITNELNRLTMLQAGGDNVGFNPNLEPTQIEVSDDEEDEEEDHVNDVENYNKTVLLSGNPQYEEDEDDDDEDDDDEDDDDEDDDDEDDDDEDDEEEEDDYDIELKEPDSLKIIGETKEIHLGEDVIDHTDITDDIDILEIESNLHETELDESDIIESLLDLEEVNNLQPDDDVREELAENTEETNKNIEIVDYKKLPVKTLREIVVQKGLVQNASKLVKKQLLELLEGN
jgi:hypothetical protein